MRDNDATMGTFINKDLTRCRSKILYEARLSAKGDNALLKAAYSSDGKIFIIDKTDTRHMVQSIDALNKLKQSLRSQLQRQNQGGASGQSR